MIYSLLDSPIGQLLLVGDGVALSALYTAEHVRRPLPSGDRDDEAFGSVRSQLDQYFGGERTDFDVPLAPVGTEFQRAVWDELRRIDYGTTSSYRDIASSIGRPQAVRAVGAANGRNPISIIVPCHRVIGSNGSLTGYAGGLAAKQWLLAHEQSRLASRAASSPDRLLAPS
ncbi:MAG: methylated-DNA-[protein]-cysteine S-methyltransferase [Pseudonocardiales bacterium]|jgi:methylated-DNA-[protein]-cysteine S-methyltransferase|nr:methylated-DNA-[protein]-cysteine S-methyltransferase [Pseudonocardiales bacterium]